MITKLRFFFFEDWVLVSRVQCRWAIASVAEVQIELMNVISKGAHKNYSWRTKSRESQGNIPMCMYSMWNNGLLHKATSLLHLNEKCEEILKVTEVENRPKKSHFTNIASKASYVYFLEDIWIFPPKVRFVKKSGKLKGYLHSLAKM